MTAEPESYPRIAVVSFLPDRGHVQPILRLAALLGEAAGARVECWIPARFEAVAAEYGHVVRPLAIDAPPGLPDLVRGLARRSLFYNAYSDSFELRTQYWLPLRETASGLMEEVAAALAAYAPSVIVCDTHLFRDYYRELARGCGATLVECRIAGSSGGGITEFADHFGHARRLPAFLQKAIVSAGRATKYGFCAARMALRPALWREMRAQDRRADERALSAVPRRETDKPVSVVRCYCGVGVLERIVKGGSPAEGVFDLLLPKRSGAPGQADDRGLWQWIRQERPRPLIFVSFGTMFRPHLGLYQAMVRGFGEADVDVLWFLPGRERESLPIGGGSAERIRFVSSIPQADVLAEEAVRLFVTHGGAGGVMEAAEAGKPMVCVPFLWDQPYNSSVVERCGLGIALAKRRVTARSLAAAIRKVLHDPAYARAAGQAAQSLRDPARLTAMRDWARDVVHRPD